jgi:hypothetical protein
MVLLSPVRTCIMKAQLPWIQICWPVSALLRLRVCARMEPQQRRMLRTLRNSESRGRGEILMDGAAARRAQVGDRVIIAAVVWMSEIEISSRKPAILLVDNANRCQR